MKKYLLTLAGCYWLIIGWSILMAILGDPKVSSALWDAFKTDPLRIFAITFVVITLFYWYIRWGWRFHWAYTKLRWRHWGERVGVGTRQTFEVLDLIGAFLFGRKG